MEPERWKKVEKIYDSAQKIEPNRRKEFLARECGRDESLRKEVERLLEREVESDPFIETPAIEMLARGLANDMELSTGMPSLIGKSLGHYQVISQLGKGGMGDVYLAKDHKLGRNVAIKVLSEEFTTDAERVARFQREAKVLASLNHPNIAAIYGLEHYDGQNFIVLELAEGETLGDRIKRGPIPLEECLKLALQIVEALEAAHEKGVVHRDLKPANISVTSDSRVKVLDFGLAKALAKEQPDLNLANSMTLSIEATREGIIFGTASYMSPEQARGKQTDKRADIWSLGCVLYEMLTGRQIWTGATITDIIAAVLVKDPDFSVLPPNLHPRIRELLSRCLQKDPMERFRDVGDVRVELKRVLEDPYGTSAPPGPKHWMQVKIILPWVAAVFLAIFSGFTVWKMKPIQPTHFDYELPNGHVLARNNLAEPMLAVSEDGTQIVYCTTGGLYLLHSIDHRDAKLIPGSEGENPRQPFFSPDGQWIGYWCITDNKLKKIRIGGGLPESLSDKEPAAGSYSWDTDDNILYSTSTEFISLNAISGKSHVFMTPKNVPAFTPRLLPGGKAVIFTISTNDEYKIAIQWLDGKYSVLTPGSDAHYCVTGHLIYIKNGDLVAVPFDLNAPEKASQHIPTTLVQDVLRTSGAPQFALSPSGTLAYIRELANDISSVRILEWVDRHGRPELIDFEPGGYSNPRLSPDGKKVALSIGSVAASQINILDLQGHRAPRTSDRYINTLPIWTPDSERIVFFRRALVNFEIYSKYVSGSENIGIVNSVADAAVIPECWSGDGKFLLTTATPIGTEKFEIRTLPTQGDHKLGSTVQSPYNLLQPQISPNGQWMAYTSDESGKYEVSVRPFPETGKGSWPVSNTGGDSPLWSPDGRELFYRSGDAVMAVPIKENTRTFETEWSYILFQGKYVRSDIGIGSYELHPWDISSDGKRFLMMKEVSATGGPRRINIVLNLFEELRQRPR